MNFDIKTTLKEVTQGSFTMAKVASGENAVLTYTGSLGITSLNRIVSIRTVMPEETSTFLQWQFENENSNSSCAYYGTFGITTTKRIFLWHCNAKGAKAEFLPMIICKCKYRF